jgi:hypothetical protein
MSLEKLLQPLLKPAARFYKARLSKELNKMGRSFALLRCLVIGAVSRVGQTRIKMAGSINMRVSL